MGDQTVWAATFFGVRSRIAVETVAVEPGRAVVERLARSARGPLASFGHVHRTDARPGGCLVWDVFVVRLVGGALGALATEVLLRRRMTALVRHRLAEIRRVAEGDAWRAFL